MNVNMLFFTPKETKRGLRAPAVIVRNTFANACVLVGSGLRWVAVLFKKTRRIFVSLHLPHSRHEIRHQLLLFPDHKFFVGVDANVWTDSARVPSWNFSKIAG